MLQQQLILSCYACFAAGKPAHARSAALALVNLDLGVTTQTNAGQAGGQMKKRPSSNGKQQTKKHLTWMKSCVILWIVVYSEVKSVAVRYSGSHC